MSKIEIFEAAGCCATSSVVVSDEAVKWNSSAEWAKSMV
nr:arsenic metallochaperone ArsD family protein [Klebsiella pneumoniae]